MMTRIVVGVDGSPTAEQALRWALAEAQLRPAATLRVVHAYTVPGARNHAPYADAFIDAGIVQRRGDLERTQRDEDETHIRQAADQLVERLLDRVEARATGVEIVPVSVANDPATTLIDMSRDADLLVVGNRGRGGFKGLLLGSVSQQCLHHARCPVAVIR